MKRVEGPSLVARAVPPVVLMSRRATSQFFWTREVARARPIPDWRVSLGLDY
jgi:hypothetical protein